MVTALLSYGSLDILRGEQNLPYDRNSGSDFDTRQPLSTGAKTGTLNGGDGGTRVFARQAEISGFVFFFEVVLILKLYKQKP